MAKPETLFENALKRAFPIDEITQDFTAEVTKVHDGDTITVKHPEVKKPFPVRFIDINAPELKQGGEESKDWLKAQIEGEEINIVLDIDNLRGKYNRLLGKIFHQGMDIGQLMILFGLAVEFGQKGYFLDLADELNDKLYKNIEGSDFP